VTIAGRIQEADERALDRRTALAALVGDHRDFLFVSGLAGASRDVAALTGDGDHLFALGGAMGAASMIGLGLALTRPADRVIVVTGDAELLMNVGCLATIAAAKPANLRLVCIDNSRNGETGYQPSHTALGADLSAIAEACGMAGSVSVAGEDEIPSAAAILRDDGPVRLVVLRVKPTEPSDFKRLMDPAGCRTRFRGALLGT